MFSLFLYFGGWSWRQAWQEGKLETIVVAFDIFTIDVGSLILILFLTEQIN